MSVRLGYDTYSIRSLKWNAFQHLEFAASLKLNAIQFSSTDVFESTGAEYLNRVKTRAAELGIRLDTGIGCVCELSKSWNARNGSPQKVLEEGLRISSILGSRAMRCFMGTDRDRDGKVPLQELMQATAANLKKVRGRALEAGIMIAVENHKDMQAWQARALIEESGTDFVGSNLDIGNPLTLMEHPLTTIETLAPYVVTSHFRDSAVYETPRGAAVQWTAMGDGSLDLRELTGKFASLCPRSSLHLEIITGRPPYQLPYLEPDFWRTFQGMPARDFARFVALAKKGTPFSGNMVIEDAENRAPAAEFRSALLFQQRHDLERSLRYCQQTLRIGVP